VNGVAALDIDSVLRKRGGLVQVSQCTGSMA
jgi:hypothetical protein